MKAIFNNSGESYLSTWGQPQFDYTSYLMGCSESRPISKGVWDSIEHKAYQGSKASKASKATKACKASKSANFEDQDFIDKLRWSKVHDGERVNKIQKLVRPLEQRDVHIRNRKDILGGVAAFLAGENQKDDPTAKAILELEGVSGTTPEPGLNKVQMALKATQKVLGPLTRPLSILIGKGAAKFGDYLGEKLMHHALYIEAGEGALRIIVNYNQRDGLEIIDSRSEIEALLEEYQSGKDSRRIDLEVNDSVTWSAVRRAIEKISAKQYNMLLWNCHNVSEYVADAAIRKK